MESRTVAEVVLAYFAVASLVLLCAYLFPPQDGPEGTIPAVISVSLLLPFYVWYRGHRKAVQLSNEVKIQDRDTVFLWVFALFTLALIVRIPSVLLFNWPYEKTPLILLVILTIVVIEKTEASAFGFTTKKLGKSLLYGLLFFLALNTLTLGITYAMTYIYTGQQPLQSYSVVPFLSAMPFMTLCVGISEEGLFRGYMQTHLEKVYTQRKAILIQALMFGAWHFVWNLSPLDLAAMAQYVATTFFIGLLFGYFYSKARSLTPLVFAHGLWDSVTQGIVENTAASNALGKMPTETQLATLLLPYVISVSLTLLFIKYAVKNVGGT